MKFRSKSGLAVVLLLACGTTYYYFGLFLPRSRGVSASVGMGGGYEYGGDLYPIWFTGRELLRNHANPYTDAMTDRIQVGLYGRSLQRDRRSSDPPPHYRAFAYPLYTDLLAVPLLPFGFPAVRIVLTMVLPLLIAGSVVLWARAMNTALSSMGTAVAIVLTLLSYPVLEGLYAQQPALWVGFWLAAGMAAMGTKRLTAAGVLLALTFIKPQVTAPLAAWLLLWCVGDWKQRRRFAAGLGVATMLLFGASEIALPGWYKGWYHSIVDYRAYTLPPLAEFVAGRAMAYMIEIAAMAVSAIAVYRARHAEAGSPAFNLAMSLVLVTTILVLPTGGAVYDHVVLIGSIVWLYTRREILASRAVRMLAIILAAVLGWQWIAATAVSIAALANMPWASTTNALLLPVRTAASLPFVLLALLGSIAIREIGNTRPVKNSAAANA